MQTSLVRGGRQGLGEWRRRRRRGRTRPRERAADRPDCTCRPPVSSSPTPKATASVIAILLLLGATITLLARPIDCQSTPVARQRTDPSNEFIINRYGRGGASAGAGMQVPGATVTQAPRRTPRKMQKILFPWMRRKRQAAGEYDCVQLIHARYDSICASIRFRLHDDEILARACLPAPRLRQIIIARVRRAR